MLKSSALVGSRVISLSRSRVRRSTSPVTGIRRLAWKPSHRLTVAARVAPVTRASYQRDLLEPGLDLAHPHAGVATLQQRLAGRVDVVQRLGRRLGREATILSHVRSSTTPSAVQPRRRWTVATPSRVSRVEGVGHDLGVEAELVEPALEHPHPPAACRRGCIGVKAAREPDAEGAAAADAEPVAATPVSGGQGAEQPKASARRGGVAWSGPPGTERRGES